MEHPAGGSNANGIAAPLVALTLARLRLAAPPAVVKLPPSRIEPSTPHSTVSTCPFTFGFHPVTRYGAVAENANALLRAMSASELGFCTAVNRPTAYIVPPHCTIWRTCSIEPSVPEVPNCGVAAEIEETLAPAVPGTSTAPQRSRR